SAVPGSFAADGLAARIRLEKAGLDGLGPAFAALDTGDTGGALELLISTIRPTHPKRDAIRRVVVGVLDELGPDDPTVATWRRRLTRPVLTPAPTADVARGCGYFVPVPSPIAACAAARRATGTR